MSAKKDIKSYDVNRNTNNVSVNVIPFYRNRFPDRDRGTSLFFSLSDLDHRISNASEANQEVVLWIQGGISIFSLLIGLLLSRIGSLCRRIVNRNIYVVELEELLEKTNEKNSC